jgi:hypothetical protein
MTDGDHNIAVGKAALLSDTRGSRSTAVGHGVLSTQNYGSSINSYNVGVGYKAGEDMTTGIQNTLVGGLSGDALTDADNNVAFGYSAMTTNVLGSESVAVGTFSLNSMNPASATNMYNVAVGHNSGASVTTGIRNTYIGALAGDGSDDGSDNTAVGKSALSVNHGNDNTAIGESALAIATGTSNTAIGKDSGSSITSGSKNTILGKYSGNANNLDIRTASNNIVLSDGDGVPRMAISGNGAYRYNSDAAGTTRAVLVGQKDSISDSTATNFAKIVGPSNAIHAFLRLTMNIFDPGVNVGTVEKTFRVFFNGSTTLLNEMTSTVGNVANPTIGISASGTDFTLSIDCNTTASSYKISYELDVLMVDANLGQVDIVEL